MAAVRYFLYLLLYIPVQLFAYLITPLLPLFAVKRMGWCDNRSYEAFAYRLPEWLAYFDTPDNSLGRDGNHMAQYGETYFSRFYGLWKNSLYNFKWSVLAAPIAGKKIFKTGNTVINHHTNQYGIQSYFTEDDYWQYKSVKPFLGKTLILNFGWLLDDPSQAKALFMCSPRWE